jgi:acyl-CoA thioester hydrolase
MLDLPITYRGVVYPWHCDHMGHMNVMWYVGKFDEATWQFFSMFGLTPSFLREQGRGMAAVQQNITYKRELHAGDVVSIRSGVLEIREKVIRFFHEMYNDETGEIAATAEMTGVHLDTARRKSCPFPEQAFDRARALILPGEGDMKKEDFRGTPSS